MMEITQYAPVVIPTLNRYEHFKRCLESLERCSGAEYTDVYIGLDYPPSDKYIEGWKLIDEYLINKEGKNGFKNLIVKRRETNCGVGGPTDNGDLLVKEILLDYDRYIFTEDDNEFSPNFLEYVNWGLEKYEEDESVYAICGYNDINSLGFENNVFKIDVLFNAWGYGCWSSRREKFLKIKDYDYLVEYVRGYKWSDVFSSTIIIKSSILFQIANKTFWGDVLRNLLPAEERWCIFPTISKVRNWGWDGSGTHGGSPEALKRYSTLPIDSSVHFSPIIKGELYNQLVLDRFKQKYKRPIKLYIRAAISLLTFKATGYIPVSNKQSKWCKVKLQKVQ